MVIRLDYTHFNKVSVQVVFNKSVGELTSRYFGPKKMLILNF